MNEEIYSPNKEAEHMEPLISSNTNPGGTVPDNELHPMRSDLGKGFAAEQALARFQKRINEIMKVMEQEMDQKLIHASRKQG
jgi:hypothetical protein